MNRLVKLDFLSSFDHAYIDVLVDECYYLGMYTSNKGFIHSETNSDILNFKKKPSTKNHPSYRYKEIALKKLALFLSQAVDDTIIKSSTFIPIPPSKIKGHIDYDDRMLRVLRTAFPQIYADIRELVIQKESKTASHETEDRPDILEVYQNLLIDEDLVNDIRDNIILFDDVLTNGTHFKAVKQLIVERFPNKRIVGIFFCRRIFSE